jgi:hypothetical protein
LIQKAPNEIPENLVSDDGEATRYNIVDIRGKPVSKSSTYKPERRKMSKGQVVFVKSTHRKQRIIIPL